MSEPLLAVRGVKSFYGNIMALKGVALDVHAGRDRHADRRQRRRQVDADDDDLRQPARARGPHRLPRRATSRDLPTHEIARLRIAQSPEGRRIFPRMTVRENLQMGAEIDDGAHFEEDLERVCDAVSRADASGSTSAAARCRAASSRCWRSPAR